MKLASLVTRALLASLLTACGSSVAGSGSTGSSSSTSGAGGAGGGSPAGTGGAGGAAPIDKAKDCAATFGSALTSGFGRLDGTVLAVVKPSDTQCPQPNSDHVVLQVTTNGAAYRMVINVQSDEGVDPNVLYQAIDHALPGDPWSEGWHTGVSLDYVTDFGVHATDAGFVEHPLAELSDLVADAITLGQKVSVYAQTSGGASAHDVHRNDGKVDGAVVLDADSAQPKVLLFHFANQTF